MNSVLDRRRVTVTGHGDRTLIFAHGFGTSQEIWKAQIELFAPQHRLILFDLAGCGAATQEDYNPRRYNSLYAYANDLLEICRALHLEGADYIGHSVSGMIGLLASLLNGKLFRSLMVIGASPRYLNDRNYYGGFEQSDVDALFHAVENNYYAWASGFASQAMGNPDQPLLSQHYAASLQSIRPDIALSVLRTVFQSDHREELSKVPVPCHILQSENDIAVPGQVGKYMAQHIPEARLVSLRASGHLPHVSAPEEVNRALAQCLHP